MCGNYSRLHALVRFETCISLPFCVAALAAFLNRLLEFLQPFLRHALDLGPCFRVFRNSP